MRDRSVLIDLRSLIIALILIIYIITQLQGARKIYLMSKFIYILPVPVLLLYILYIVPVLQGCII